ncbi:cAMP-regulated phosphoprotein 19-like [Dermacentor variabilis]|uniref:cAMP-regulated phosphoprotein 19-like n=1 Tax=Dermacentor variabilis TaxID=34621 RepID=UPI003F5C8A5D
MSTDDGQVAEGSADADTTGEDEQHPTVRKEELEEETKLKQKYPVDTARGGSLFLQKRLKKGQKYFDSGDYNMAKAKGEEVVPQAPPAVLPKTTGVTIPTAESLPPRKAPMKQSKLAMEPSS